MRLILASSSPYRRELLQRLGIRFTVASPGIEETLDPRETPEDAVLRLARAKALAVAAREPEAFILASDQLASVAGHALGKPNTRRTAEEQLTAMSGHTIVYCTAVVLATPESGISEHLDRSRVVLRQLTPAEITRYLDAERPLDCAGALKLEGMGIALCERVETADPSALIGLPLTATARLLREKGFRVP